MIIIGVDPGTICTGVGVIEYEKNQLKPIFQTAISQKADGLMSDRLKKIYDELCKIIEAYSPDEFAIETAFYGKNVQSALKIGYARGVSILAAANHKLIIAEYAPREIKKSVVGKGAATKEQVQYMIRTLLSLKSNKMKFDETDALAVAICHAFRANTKTSNGHTWKDFIEANPGRVIL
jgi:crossover junction endodeoxyribonuclease RuvC